MQKEFKFGVEIDDVASTGFQKCSELSVEVASIDYYEGGSLIPNKSPGRVKFADVTLERGAASDARPVQANISLQVDGETLARASARATRNGAPRAFLPVQGGG